VLDFTEDPWPALSGTADQQGVGAGGVEHGLGFLWGVDIAVGENRNRYRLLDGGNGLVLGFAGVQIGTGAPVYRQCSDAGIFGDFRYGDAVPVLMVPAGADLQGDRYVHRTDHRIENLAYQWLIAQQGGAGGLVADLLCRAAHVDVD